MIIDELDCGFVAGYSIISYLTNILTVFILILFHIFGNVELRLALHSQVYSCNNENLECNNENESLGIFFLLLVGFWCLGIIGDKKENWLQYLANIRYKDIINKNRSKNQSTNEFVHFIHLYIIHIEREFGSTFNPSNK
ncbi:hypothetical protein DERF_009033 [Dermatophagoides farinae]|uniref:Uncharacterized protein n=1 Tax=Dermatophagoides farinae TaxID=6954 RepID=A0A922HT75_DERFA|nr:hypothetical protein DERF_009033 [Dermatophagoides farinae]